MDGQLRVAYLWNDCKDRSAVRYAEIRRLETTRYNLDPARLPKSTQAKDARRVRKLLRLEEASEK